MDEIAGTSAATSTLIRISASFVGEQAAIAPPRIVTAANPRSRLKKEASTPVLINLPLLDEIAVSSSRGHRIPRKGPR
jgi:hypothetical protein